MDLFGNVFGACNSVYRQQQLKKRKDDNASPVQLNAFEFRNYRTSLDEPQQLVVERVVNQWCSMLVKGKKMTVEGMEETVALDKDMLTLIYRKTHFPLRGIYKMEMVSDPDEMLTRAVGKYVLDIGFEGEDGDIGLRFNFAEEAPRLNFALTLRILRTRDPTLDPSSKVEVSMKDTDEDGFTFNRLVAAQHYNIDAGIPIIFSVSDLKVLEKLRSSSRHSYLEFFVKYPQQDKFLYAKSPTTPIPPQVIQTDEALTRKKGKKTEEEEEEEKRKADTKRQVLGDEIAIKAMKFELKNVKLKIPKVPHTLFGRLMAKDEYFPTAIGTFELTITRAHLQNRMRDPEEKKKGNPRAKELPDTMRLPVMSSWKAAKQGAEDHFFKIGTLTLRVMGYVTEPNEADEDDASPQGHGGGDQQLANIPEKSSSESSSSSSDSEESEDSDGSQAKQNKESKDSDGSQAKQNKESKSSKSSDSSSSSD